MTQDQKIQLFESVQVRSQWDAEAEKWYFSVVDVVQVLTDSSIPKRYWSDLRRKLEKESGQSYEEIVRLKMKAADGRLRDTDTADVQTLLRLIQSIPSPKAEPFKQWLAKVGYERMQDIADPAQIKISLSTPTAASIATLVQSRYNLTNIVESEFLCRGFNQVYKLSCTNGQRVVARISTERPRGGPNVLFESAVLGYLARAQCPVARCLSTTNGDFSIDVSLPEGTRKLMLFEYVDGESTSDTDEDVRAFAHGLAALHICGESYRGPASTYTLDLDHLLLRPLESLLRAPTMTAEFRPQFESLGQRLHHDILEFGALSRVLCHGDAHGRNHFITTDPQGKRQAIFFDFDDAGPGYLSYELAVYPWVLHPRTQDGVLSDKSKEKWAHFIDAYREMKAVSDVDLAAISRFMAVRQIWVLGEYAGKVSTFGSQAIPTDYLRRQANMLQQWETLKL